MPDQEEPLFCDRCTTELQPGQGNFYLVKIEAFADPTPPVIGEEELSLDVGAELERLIAEMQSLSPREAMDQVYRRLTIYLCRPCYCYWIENPVG